MPSAPVHNYNPLRVEVSRNLSPQHPDRNSSAIPSGPRFEVGYLPRPSGWEDGHRHLFEMQALDSPVVLQLSFCAYNIELSGYDVDHTLKSDWTV